MIETRFNDLTSSIIARSLEDDFEGIRGYHIAVLEVINGLTEPISTDELVNKTKIPKDAIQTILNKLIELKLIRRNSPEYVITKEGREIITAAYKALPEMEKILRKDSYLHDLNKSAGSLVG